MEERPHAIELHLKRIADALDALLMIACLNSDQRRSLDDDEFKDCENVIESRRARAIDHWEMDIHGED